MNQNFRFFTDSISISKAKDANGKEIMRLGGIASTSDKDADGEYLDPSGFDVTYLKNEGIVNWHHGAKTNPETIIGEPSKVEIDKRGLYLEVDLYPHSDMAKKVYKLAEVLEKSSKNRRLGFSIEGKAIERDVANNKIIKKAAITGVAITHMPKNPSTFVQVLKGHVEDEEEINTESQQSVEEINKALSEELRKAKIALADEILKSSCDSDKIIKDEDEEQEDTEKSLDTQSGKAVIKEHVDGMKVITKSELYTRIFDTFPDIDVKKARKIEQIIQKTTTMSGRKAPTEADITKALETLGISEEGITLEKCIEIGNDLIDDGKTIDDIEKALLKEGAEDDMIIKALEEIKKGDMGGEEEEEEEEREEQEEEEEEEAPAMKKGSKYMRKGGDKFSKENGDVKEIKKSLDSDEDDDVITKAIQDLNTKQDRISKAIGTVLSDIVDSNKVLLAQIEQLTSDVETIKKGGNGRKSVPSAAYLDRFKDNDIEKGGEGSSNTLSVSKNKHQVLNLLEKAAFASTSNGGALDPVFEKAISTFEVSGMLSRDVINRIQKDHGVTLVA